MRNQHLTHICIINVAEMWLKGKNRPMYYQALRKHVVTIARNYHEGKFACDNEGQRLVARSDVPFSEEFIQALARVPGTSSVVPARRLPPEFPFFLPAAIEEMRKLLEEGRFPRTFKVETNRVDKRFPMRSMDVSRELGGGIKQAFQEQNLQVDVSRPETTVEVRILNDNAYISCRKIPGPGGFPVGTSGRAVTLLSGGFDSPVASHMMMKRGCEQVLMFAYAYPYVGDEVRDKIVKLSCRLGLFQRCTYLYVVPFGDLQTKIAEHCKPEYRTVLFRLAMLEAANLLADEVGALALVTGDSLGQVSSQTLQNMSLLDRHSRRMVMRPLIGMNKTEIIKIAEEIGTYPISVLPQDDACALFAAKHPILRPDGEYVREFLAAHDLTALAKTAVERAQVVGLSARGESNVVDRNQSYFKVPADS